MNAYERRSAAQYINNTQARFWFFDSLASCPLVLLSSCSLVLYSRLGNISFSM